MSNKKQSAKKIHPFIIKGMNSFSGMNLSSINPFLNPETQISVLNIDTETHFFGEKKADPETEEV